LLPHPDQRVGGVLISLRIAGVKLRELYGGQAYRLIVFFASILCDQRF
jgi:hypothetical protein